MPKLCIIIPCYYNEQNIPVTLQALNAMELQLPSEVQCEYVLVDDGSLDNTWNVIKKYAQTSQGKIHGVKLAGNTGSYTAIIAGMEQAKGDVHVIMTADLQDPPELIPEMLQHWLHGYKLVLAHRIKRDDPWLSKLFSGFYHNMIRRFALKNLPKGGFDYVLFDDKLRKEVVQIKEKNTNTLFLLPLLGYPYVSIPYHRKAREIGTSRWTTSKKIKLFVDSFVAFSYWPVRMISIVGLLLGISAIIYALLILFQKLNGSIHVEGWTSMMIIFLFVASFQMIAIGILGEYLWRTLDAVRKRPLYIVDEVV